MLHITRITISRFRYFIEVEGEGFLIAWDTLKDEETKKEIHDFLVALAGYAARAAGGRVKPTIF